MAKTIDVAADREFDDTKTVLPAEVARGIYVYNPPSLRALKIMHLMIGTAGGRMADEVQHSIRLSGIRKIDGMSHHDRKSLEPLFTELRAATLVSDDAQKKRITIGGILDEAIIDYREESSGDLVVSWWFGRTFRRMAAESNHWAILDRQTVFHLGSKYSVLMFQHIASLANLDRINSKTFTIPELRALLGVPAGKLDRFADLHRRAVQAAVDEINQLSRLNLTVTPQKVGRTVAAVEIEWTVKGDATAAARELRGHSAGRKARRNGTAEAVAEPVAFPETGGITYSPRWLDLKRAAGCNMDNNEIATRFRRFLTDRGIKRDAANVEKLFSDFCAKVGKV